MHPIFDIIDMSNLSIIGSGAYNVCLTDGRYAIKIGTTSQYSVNEMNDLYNAGYGIRVYAFEKYVELPETIITIIKLQQGYAYGCKGLAYNIEEYLRGDKYADVLITELVKPLLSHKKKYSESYTNKMYNKANRLAAQIKTIGFSWNDAHPWNIGVNKRGKLVVLDT